MSDLLVDNKVVIKNVNAVIFDKDGTLIDIHYYWVSIIKLRATLVAKKWFKKCNKAQIEEYLINIMGVDLVTKKMKPDGPVGVLPRREIVTLVADFVRKSSNKITDDDIEEIFINVDKISSRDMISFVKILPGVQDLLIKLKDFNIQSIIISNDITSRAKLAMKALNLDKYFSKIIGGDLAEKVKPNPDLALLALNDLELNSSNVAIVGDHPFDIMMGTAANLGINIAVLTGLTDSSAKFNDLECVVVEDLKQISIC